MRLKASRVRIQRASATGRVTTCVVAVALASALPAAPAKAVIPPGTSTPAAYVDKNSVGGSCDDGRSFEAAGSPGTPWCSPARAVAAAPAGSTVYLRRAAYAGVGVTAASSRTDYATLTPYSGEESQVTVAGANFANTRYLRLRGLIFTVAIQVDHGASDVKLERLTGKNVIIQDGVSNVTVEDSTFTMTSGTSGLVFLSSSASEPPISNVTIRRNVLDGGHVSVNLRNFRNALVEDNEMRNVSRYGTTQHTDVIRTYGGGSGLVVRRNHSHDNAGIGFFIKDGPVSDVTFENNLIRNQLDGFEAVKIYDVTGLRAVNNTVPGAFTFAGKASQVSLVNNIIGSFKLYRATVSYTTRGYNLIAAGTLGSAVATDIIGSPTYTSAYELAPGSKGIDAGTSDGAPTHDRLNAPRVDDPLSVNLGGGSPTYYDIGAHEYGSVPDPGTPAPPPTP